MTGHRAYGPHEQLPKYYDYEEFCPHCGYYIPVVADEEQADLELICPVCNNNVMLCSACTVPCNWSEANGCSMDKKHIGGSNENRPM